VSITVKAENKGTRKKLAEELDKEVQRVCHNQYHAFNMLKDILLHVENYSAKYASEIQPVHFGGSKRLIGLHTGVVYMQNNIHTFCTVSDCLKYGPAAIWAHLEPEIDYM